MAGMFLRALPLRYPEKAKRVAGPVQSSHHTFLSDDFVSITYELVPRNLENQHRLGRVVKDKSIDRIAHTKS